MNDQKEQMREQRFLRGVLAAIAVPAFFPSVYLATRMLELAQKTSAPMPFAGYMLIITPLFFLGCIAVSMYSKTAIFALWLISMSALVFAGGTIYVITGIL